MVMKIEVVLDENGFDTMAYFTRGHVSKRDFGRAMVDRINGETATNPDTWWVGEPPGSAEIHYDTWRIRPGLPGEQHTRYYMPAEEGKQGAFPVTYYCHEGLI